ncbi:ABC transporter ATP-binding protein [Microvirga pakistanensis]|uniref:ABC transporter ATP-binding protein n=1 Tax=Microvirga pakistanensis TaxID=1682650 RepID=UPI00106B463C|nr:ABC transporter ATP-binding protein [Microvirga pakistanensis]
MSAKAETASPVLFVKNLSTSFRMQDGRFHKIVKDVSFDVGPRETVALVGESGSGKSVTALSIMRLLAASNSRVEGSIQLGGTELLALPEAKMQAVRGNEIAMIFQEPMTSLNPVLPIGSQIAEVLTRHRAMSQSAAHAETIRLLEKVRIPEARSRFAEYPHRLSGGMRQRVMIAMALACRPKLLIADEPTTALDVTIQAQTLALIKALQDEDGMSVLFITHDMGVVAEIADRTVVMFKGEAVEVGRTEDIFNQPRHPYSRTLLSSVPKLGSMTGVPEPMRLPVFETSRENAETVPKARRSKPGADQPLLSVRNLTTRFDIRSGLLRRVSGRVHAVENVSFDIMPGETLSLVGESGCGKSTTGRSVTRLVEPTSGEIRLVGTDIMELNGRALRAMRRNVQMIFQDPFASLDPRTTVGAAVAEPILTHELETGPHVKERVADLLRRVGLGPDVAGRYPHEFSGGQRQRICIARALALDPKLIVADEAVSALDVSIKAQVMNLLLDLQETLGLAYLFISHDMAVVERVSHRVAVMYLGEIVEIGPRSAVFENPQHPYTRKLIAAVPIPDPARRGVKRPLLSDEIRSPVRPTGYEPAIRVYREVSPGHFVQQWGEEWGNAA